MHGFWGEWALLAAVMATAAASPGPDFVIAVRNSVLHARRAGLMTALGFALGVGVHAGYSLAGIGAVIAGSEMLFTAVRFGGAVYLAWLGLRGLMSKGAGADTIQADGLPQSRLSDGRAVWMGFLTNLLNPKAVLFFIAVFTQVVRPDVPVTVQSVYALTCMIIVGGWFAFVALVLTSPAVRAPFVRASIWIDRLCGALLIVFSLRLIMA